MGAELRNFIHSYIQAVNGGYAAVFAGAGLSRAAGYVDWRGLLRELAEQLGLNVDKETDLVALAQFHVNENGGNRGLVNQLLVEEFTREAKSTENHQILATLPIQTYWTTNYDTLIEDALVKHGKHVDVKKRPQDLVTTLPGADAVVYKMHGDISMPDEAVLTKDDYENYRTLRELFVSTLQGHLLSKTFLFVGFSFTDPNLEYILAGLRVLLGKNQRQHFCLMRRVAKMAGQSDEEFGYEKARQDLRIRDLKRYGIHLILVDEYHEITECLKSIQAQVVKKNVLISGSAHTYAPWTDLDAAQFCRALSRDLIDAGCNIVSGVGLGIGGNVIVGALEAILRKKAIISNLLHLRPFPQPGQPDPQIAQTWEALRADMAAMSGIAIFLFGNKLDNNNNVTEAKGMEREFDLCVARGVIPIPVGATGDFTAKRLWEKVMAQFDTFVTRKDLKPLYEKLGDATLTPDELRAMVVEIVSKLLNP